tara:strand:+ start:32092 stop:32373 length:282 start_codon:yes stop_codon:yes gene_type:complete
MKATWNGAVIAESDDTVVAEGSHYFPIASLKREFLKDSDKRTSCPWKGQAHYWTLVVDGKENADAAWFYPEPTPEAKEITDRVAFWRGVDVSE